MPFASVPHSVCSSTSPPQFARLHCAPAAHVYVHPSALVRFTAVVLPRPCQPLRAAGVARRQRRQEPRLERQRGRYVQRGASAERADVAKPPNERAYPQLPSPDMWPDERA